MPGDPEADQCGSMAGVEEEGGGEGGGIDVPTVLYQQE